MNNYLRVAVILMMCICAREAYAQDNPFLNTPIVMGRESPVCIRVGLSAGGNATRLVSKVSDFSNLGFRFGADGGVFLNVRFLPRNAYSNADNGLLAIQPEVNFSMFGGNSPETKLGLTYVSFPVMIQIYPIKGFYIEAGPMPMLNIGHTPNVIVTGSTEYHLDNMKANDIMAVAGIGFSISGFSIGARYCFGMSNVAKNLPWRNQGIQVRLAYGFKLGGGQKKAVSIDF